MGVEALTTGNQSPPSPPAIRANRQGLAEPPIRSERGRAAIVGLQTFRLEFEETVSPGRYGPLVADHLMLRGAPEPGFTITSTSRLGLSDPDRSLATRFRAVRRIDHNFRIGNISLQVYQFLGGEMISLARTGRCLGSNKALGSGVPDTTRIYPRTPARRYHLHPILPIHK